MMVLMTEPGKCWKIMAGWYPEQVVLHHRTEHTGGAAGIFFWLMQEALKDEKNEYILFSDQDDVWENDKVSVMLHRMKVLEKGLGQRMPDPAVFRYGSGGRRAL